MYNNFNLSFSYYLVISHVNVNSLVNKISYIHSLVNDCNLDVLGISETWLNDEIYNSIVSIAGYEIVRSDSPSGRKHGVCIYVKIGIKYEVINVDVPNVALLYLLDYGLYIIMLYRPPSYTDIDNRVLIEFLMEFCNNKEVLIMGDFNLPSLDWSGDNVLSNYILPNDQEFLNAFNLVTRFGASDKNPNKFSLLHYN